MSMSRDPPAARARSRSSASASAIRRSARSSAARRCARRAPVHGKTSPIHHDGRGVFAGLPSPFEATRYHSLIVERATLPACLEISAETEDGLDHGPAPPQLPVEGVQFHPESILTAAGKALLGNFLARLGSTAPEADGTVPARASQEGRWCLRRPGRTARPRGGAPGCSAVSSPRATCISGTTWARSSAGRPSRATRRTTSASSICIRSRSPRTRAAPTTDPLPGRHAPGGRARSWPVHAFRPEPRQRPRRGVLAPQLRDADRVAAPHDPVQGPRRAPGIGGRRPP